MSMSTQSSQERRASLRRQLLLVVVLIAAIIGIVGGAAYGVSRYLWNNSETVSAEWGTCHGVLHVTCVDVPMKTIERDSGIVFPRGTRIVSSGSTGPNALGQGSIRAELLLPADTESPLAAQMAKSDATYSAAWNRISGLDELKSRGLRNVKGLADPPRTFVQGETSDGRITIILNADDPHH
jgi:hypothetical protein